MKARTILILIIAALLPLTLSSCMNASGNEITGQWRVTSLGTDISDLDISTKSMTASKVDQSTGLKAAATGITDLTKIKANTALFGRGIGALKSATETLAK